MPLVCDRQVYPTKQRTQIAVLSGQQCQHGAARCRTPLAAGGGDSPLSLDKPITETAYLTAPNFPRYRRILRFFYTQHQKLHYWLTAETVAAHLQTDPQFTAYTLDQCQQDLTNLVEWKNLMATQDAARVQTIEEFKNRRFRYQLTPYTVEIERLTLRLESISGVGGSLEATLFERIARQLEQLPQLPVDSAESASVHQWWQDLSADFRRLNENATDFIASLQGSQMDQLASTTAFMTYKESFIEYLRSFIRELQRCGPLIGSLLRDAPPELVQAMLQTTADYAASIARMGHPQAAANEPDPAGAVGNPGGTSVSLLEDILAELQGQWNSLAAWFLGGSGGESEAEQLLDITNTIIRRITRYANRMAESQNRAVSRHQEYRHLAELFTQCATIEEAHTLASVVFGAVQVKHLHGDFVRQTDSIHSSVYEETPFYQEIRPKVRTFSERAATEAIIDRRAEKQQTVDEYLAQQDQARRVMEALADGTIIDFAKLPEIDPFVRHTLLRWLGRAMQSPTRQAKTEDGRPFVVSVQEEEIVVHCTDGDLAMPHVVLEFAS